MADQTNTILSDAEIAAALAEVESLAATGRDGIPSLDDGRGGPPIVVVPVPQHQPAREQRGGQPGRAAPTPNIVTGTVQGEERRAAQGDPPALGHPGVVETADADACGALVRCSRWAYLLVDRVLDTINRPFGWLSPGARAGVGTVAIVTIVCAVLVGLVLPVMWPRFDPVAFLDAKVAAIETAPTKAAPASPPAPAAKPQGH